jgi:hypothetical protein
MLKLRSLSLALAASLSLFGTTGCLKQMILDGQIASTRKASVAIDSFSDYEVANAVAFSGVAQFEGMHYLAPDNEDALFMLTKGWAGATFGFIEDQMEQAEDTEGIDSDLYAYHRARAIAGYDRAIHYGIQLLEMRNAGFDAARKNDETMKAWLAGFTDKSDGANLFWTGYAWLAKTNVAKDEPAVVSDLFIAVAMLERSVALDETYMNGSGRTALGAYHARTALAELDEAKREFDRASAINGGKLLLTKFQLAARYYCMKSDKANYERILNEVVDAGDVFPAARLQNTIAKRRAKRYLSKQRQENCGF